MSDQKCEVPALVGQHLDAVHCTNDDQIILAASDLTRRYWNGSLWCFSSVDNAPNVENCSAGIEVKHGIGDIVCFNDNKIAIGLDSGAVEFYELNSDCTKFTHLFSALEHDDFITSLDVSSNASQLVSVGADKCVKIWNLTTWSTEYTYRPVHAGTIWQVACSVQDPEVFITCGQDGKLLLFDIRLPKPATVLETSPLKGEITSVSWNPLKSSQIAVGDEMGQIAIQDIRSVQTLFSWSVHKRRIFRSLFSKNNPWLATCADDNYVCVSDLSNSEPVISYQDCRHDDFVRDLSWNNSNDLISCSWDKKVLRHIIKVDS